MNQGLYSLIDDTEPKLGDDAPVKDILALNARKAKALSFICMSIEDLSSRSNHCKINLE